MSKHRQELGKWGESIAAGYLAARGYSLVNRNVRTAHGELDIITRQGDILVFVEVKTRSNTAFGHPEDAVTRTKQARLIAAAQDYLQTHPEIDRDWRIDVIAIRRRKHQEPEILHFENAVTG